MLTIFKTFIILLALQIKPVFGEVFTVVSDYWCPYNCEPNAKPEGFGIDLLKQAFEANGITVKYTLMPWDQALAAVADNQFHAVMSANKTDSRKLLFPEAYFSRSTTCFFTRADSTWEYNGVHSINKIQLGVIKAYSYGAQIDHYLQQPRDNIHEVMGRNPLDALFEKMKNNEIDAIIEDKHVFQYQVSLHKDHHKFKTSYCLPAANIYMAFAPNHPDTKKYMKIYDDRMRIFFKGETYKKIVERYK